MQRHVRGPKLFVLPFTLILFVVIAISVQPSVLAAPPAGETSGQTPGSLGIVGKDGKIQATCPLKHTDVHAGISGFLARVTVTQTFANTATQNIEAVYAFPLPQDAAVDDMTIQIGDRTVRGLIKRREEARAIYEKAKQHRPRGRAARPGAAQHLHPVGRQHSSRRAGQGHDQLRRDAAYEAGSYEFVFPMVVGPRYIPGQPTGYQGTGWAPDTNRVPDASRITPWVAAKGTRAGHDISLELALDAGVPIQDLRSNTHDIDIDRSPPAASACACATKPPSPTRISF